MNSFDISFKIQSLVADIQENHIILLEPITVVASELPFCIFQPCWAIFLS